MSEQRISPGVAALKVKQIQQFTDSRVCSSEFFSYPVELSWDTLRKLGPIKVLKIALTYAKSALLPIRPGNTLEDFLISYARPR